ncbi:MAG: N-acetylmuramic acid 6-phosphate etherase [Anaerolineae bacterium]
MLSHDLDLRATLELVALMHLEDNRAVRSIRPNLPAISNAAEAIAARMRQGGRLIYIGAGTSGRLGALDAAECPPTFGTAPGQVLAIIAGGERALTSAVEAAEDDEKAGRQAIVKAGIGALDSVVGLSASGRTPYVVGAVKEARRRGALTVAVVCNLPSPVAHLAEKVLAPLVGPEVITGSTRLKAGTAQKLILNMLSTGVMVRMGKTYGNLMADLHQQSDKLEQRARRIVAQACNISEEQAEAALLSSQGDVKVAIVSTMLGCTPAQAREKLAQAAGEVRTALQSHRRP